MAYRTFPAGWAKMPFPGCETFSGKLRQKWYGTAGTKFTKPGKGNSAHSCICISSYSNTAGFGWVCRFQPTSSCVMYVVETCCEPAPPEAACTPRGGIGGGAPFETAAAVAAAGGPDDVDRPKLGLSAAADLAGWESCCFSGETEGVLGGAWTTSDTAESDPSVPEKKRVRLRYRH